MELVDLDLLMKKNEDENLDEAMRKIIEYGGAMKEKWSRTFPHRKSMLDIAREMFPIQQMPPGATPTYERDIEIAPDWIAPELPSGDTQVINEEPNELGFQGWITPDDPFGFRSMTKPETLIEPPSTTNGEIHWGHTSVDIPNLKPIMIDNTPKSEPWIQTYTGRKFNPINPVEGSIVIEDIAHSLAHQCRFSGHTKKFYSVAQHCVLVSYICDEFDALHGLLHDASEGYLVDVPSPLKRSSNFDAYRRLENNLQSMIYKRFGLDTLEPKGVKRADVKLLATEARDLMSPLHSDWVQPTDPLPFKIIPLPPQEAKDLFMKRFYELNNAPGSYEHYLRNESRLKDI